MRFPVTVSRLLFVPRLASEDLAAHMPEGERGTLQHFATSMLSLIQLACVWALLFSTGAIHAQVASGAIEGAVTDPNGATVATSTVSAKSLDTGTVRAVTPGSAGIYSIPSLQPGNYQITVTAQGFATEVTNVTVSLNQTRRA